MSKTTGQSKDLDFLFEMGQVRYIDRMWRRFLSKDFANLADHHFRVFWIAMVIAAREGEVDTGKIAKMALAHDIAESRTGDVDYLARQYTERNEELAIHDMLADTSLEKEFLEIVKEYEERKSLEAKIVKDADNLDVDFELSEQAVQGNAALAEAWHASRKKNVRSILFTKTAKQIFDDLEAADPHNWHLTARNRHNAGDWSRQKP